jgi:uncharacterized phage protein (TIGR01671 family)
MREIKFRAWHIADHKMLQSGEIFTIGACGEMIQYADQGYLANNANASEEHKEYLIANNIEPKDEFVLMQYTDLKDKNGVEIYEGDILEYKSANPDQPGVFRNYVDWFSGTIHCGFRLKNGRWTKSLTLNTLINSNSKVIGNIYEHPHLLNAEK